MEISRRLFILLVSMVIGFMLALVVAVGFLVLRGPAGQLHAAHALGQGDEGLDSAAENESDDKPENRLAEIGDNHRENRVAAEDDKAGNAERASERPANLQSLSPASRALFAQDDKKEAHGEADAGEKGGGNEKDAGGVPAGRDPAELAPDSGAVEPTGANAAPTRTAVAAKASGAHAEGPSLPHEPEVESAAPEEPEPTAPPAPIEPRAPEASGVEAEQAHEPKPAPTRPTPGDSDGDGIPDSSDKCVDQPEDKDGFLDRDGCPDPDNDQDGILDAQDKCPFEKETLNGYQDDDGCPDEAKAAAPAPVERPSSAPAGKTWSVYFGHMRWALAGSGKTTLKRIARAARGRASQRVFIQGHSDAGGRAAVNRWYANKRSKSVRKYLVKKGVAQSRIQILDAVIVDGGGSGAKARDKSNRRVDIILAD